MMKKNQHQRDNINQLIKDDVDNTYHGTIFHGMDDDQRGEEKKTTEWTSHHPHHYHHKVKFICPTMMITTATATATTKAKAIAIAIAKND